jgi:flagellar basal-body rod protein FlgC
MTMPSLSTRPMSLFEIAGRAASAQLVRLNTAASNLANAGSVAGTEAGAYRALKPVFRTVMGDHGQATVDVAGVVQSDITPTMRHAPGDPNADADGNVWDAGVDSEMEMVEMLEAARQYQNNLAVMDTAKTLILETLRVGR